MAPVGIVAVVSMKTIMKKNRAITLTSSTPSRQKPLVPNRPYLKTPVGFPSGPIVGSTPTPWFSTANPGPSEGYQPGGTGPLNQLPQPIAKPYTQNPRPPSG